MERIALIAYLASMLSYSVSGLPISWVPVFDSFTAGTEGQVLRNSFSPVIGRFQKLKVGSTYVGNGVNIASNTVDTYFMFRSSLTRPLLQGIGRDSGIIDASSTLVIENKLLVVSSLDAFQR